MNNNHRRAELISAGVRNLQEYGYPGVNANNILTDRIYSAFFKTMLEGTVESAPLGAIKDAARELLKEVSA